jgi:hypothetical protein
MNVENATREGRHDLEARSLQHARPSNAAAQVFLEYSPHLYHQRPFAGLLPCDEQHC